MERTRKEIEKEIIEYLDENSTKISKPGSSCALGTCKDDIPRVTPIDFYNDGLTLWMTGDPGGKIENIRANPNVSVSIYSPIDRSKVNRSIMLKGKASLVTYREQKDLYMEVITKIGILDMLKKAIRSGAIGKRSDLGVTPGEDFEAQMDKMMHIITMIKVEPEIIALRISPPGGAAEGAGERLVWEKKGLS